MKSDWEVAGIKARTNLLRTQQVNYVSRITLPNSYEIDDRQILAGVRFHF